MSWFDTKGLAILAKSALKEAQKQIDKALEIQEEDEEVKKDCEIKIREPQPSGSFFGNPNANEMVTSPPKACAATEISYISGKTSTTKNVDSVEISYPAASTDTEPGSGPGHAAATADMTISQPETVITAKETNDANASDEKHADNESKALLHSSSSSSTMKLLMSMEEVSYTESQNADSDSTSFEDVHMQTSVTQTSTAVGMNLETNKEEFDHIIPTPSFSAPNSNDEVETTTSSDIEIISNPNGDSSSTNSTTRTSPLKLKKFGNSQTVLQTCSLASKKKGHYREPSEISILSEDSQSEIDKLVHRISELNEILEARELRLLQSERQNAQLQESNTALQATVDSFKRNTVMTDADGEYTQQLHALERKFQASKKDREILLKQISALKEDMHNKISKDDLTAKVSESNAMIAELRLEGEKLSKEILLQSNIIKKLRAKEKSSDVLLKKQGEQITTMVDEMERLKRTLSAKEDMERSQIEAVHKMSSEQRKLEEENSKHKNTIEDLLSKQATLQARFDAVKVELQQRSRLQCDITRTAEEASAAKKEIEITKTENQEMLQQLNELNEKLRFANHITTKREKQLIDENKQLLSRLEEAELRIETSSQEVSLTTIPLMRQLESLQNTLSVRTSNWNKEEKSLLEKLEITQARLKSLENLEATYKEKLQCISTRCTSLEESLSVALLEKSELKLLLEQAELDFNVKENILNRKIATLNDELSECKKKIEVLEEKNKQMEEKIFFEIPAPDKFPKLTESTFDETVPVISSQQQQQRSQSPTNSFGFNSLEDSIGGVGVDWQTENMDCISNSERHANTFAYGSQPFFGNHNTSTLEHLQALLKQRDGELNHQQWEVSRLQAERDLLTAEISNLTLEIESAQDNQRTFETLKKSFDELQLRYDALLEMYGEKMERTEELELDLFELKEAYKTQINELLANPRTS